MTSDYDAECPLCGKEMRRRWAWWPYCSSECVAASQEDDE